MARAGPLLLRAGVAQWEARLRTAAGNAWRLLASFPTGAPRNWQLEGDIHLYTLRALSQACMCPTLVDVAAGLGGLE